MHIKTELESTGSILLIDKPLRWTSFDVVKKVRNTLGIKKVGHAGTLDPLATGLLIICTGKKTKTIQQFVDMEKEYTGTLVLGKTTPSVDLETDFDSESPWDHIDPETCKEMTQAFVGEITQVPPAFSAIKIGGKRAYEEARKGSKIQLKGRTVTIKQFELTSIEFPCIDFSVVCSKGTYIRSLVRDFGVKLSCGAYLSNLRRTRIGEFKIDDALTIQQIQENEGL